MYSSAGTGCTLRINETHVGSLVNGDTTTGWETTNNFAAVSNSSDDGSGTLQAAFRVVVDQQIVEVFCNVK